MGCALRKKGVWLNIIFKRDFLLGRFLFCGIFRKKGGAANAEIEKIYAYPLYGGLFFL